MDMHAFQGQWNEHVAPLLQSYSGINMSALFGIYALKVCMLY